MPNYMSYPYFFKNHMSPYPYHVVCMSQVQIRASQTKRDVTKWLSICKPLPHKTEEEIKSSSNVRMNTLIRINLLSIRHAPIQLETLPLNLSITALNGCFLKHRNQSQQGIQHQEPNICKQADEYCMCLSYEKD